MANNEVTLKVTADTKQAEKQVEGLTKSFSEAFSSGTKEATKSFNSLFSTSSIGIGTMVKGLGLATVAIGAVGYAVKEAFSAFEDLAKIADETNKVNKQFDFLAQKAGDTGGNLRSSFESVNLGIIDTEEILKSASVALTNLNLPTQDIAKNFEAARRTAVALGGDTIQNFEAINTAIASGNTRVLKQIGLFIDADSAVADYAKSIGVAAKYLTDAQREAAIFAAIQAKVSSSFSNVDLSTKTTSESFQQFRTAVSDVGEAIAIAFNKMFGPGVSSLLQKFSAGLSGIANEILANFGSNTEKAAAKQELLNDKLNEEIEKLDKLKKIQDEQIGRSLSGIDTRVKKQQEVVDKIQLQLDKEEQLKAKQQQTIDALRLNDSVKEELSAKDIERNKALLAAQEALVGQTRAQEISNIDAKIANTQSLDDIEQLSNDKKLLSFEQNQQALKDLDLKFKEQGLSGTLSHQEAQKALIEKGALDIYKIETDAEKRKQSLKDAARAKDLANQEAFLSTAATLSNSKNKELAAIGKAAAITQIAIKTPPAVASSFEFGTKIGGPPLGFIFGGIAAAAMAAQAAAIAGVPLATGITEVPRGFPNDTFAANLTSGERVLSVPQNQDLNRFLSAQESGVSSSKIDDESKSLLQAIVNRLGALENTIIVNVGSREIMREVREGIRSGQQVAI